MVHVIIRHPAEIRPSSRPALGPLVTLLLENRGIIMGSKRQEYDNSIFGLPSGYD